MEDPSRLGARSAIDWVEELASRGVAGRWCKRGRLFLTLVRTWVVRKEEAFTLPLDESVHAHEGSELLWNQRKSAVGEDSCIPED